MRRKILTKTNKELLFDFSLEKIKSRFDYSNLEKVKSKFKEEFLAEYDRTYSKKDLEILNRYNCSTKSEVFYFYIVEVERKDFNNWEHSSKKVIGEYYGMPELEFPRPRNCGWEHLLVKPESILAKLWFEHQKVSEKIEKEIEEKHEAYKQVIRSYKFYEELCEFWPEALEVREEIMPNPTSLIVIDPKVRSMVERDFKKAV